MARQAAGLNTKGMKPLLEKLRALKDVSVSQAVAEMLGTEGNGFRKLALEKIRSANWPKEALGNQGFVDKRWPQSKGRKAKVTILFGFAKRNRPGYVEWIGKDQGRKIGMSLLTLYEFGGLRKTGSPWYRPAIIPAIKHYRKTTRANIKAGVEAILLKRIGGISSNG